MLVSLHFVKVENYFHFIQGKKILSHQIHKIASISYFQLGFLQVTVQQSEIKLRQIEFFSQLTSWLLKSNLSQFDCINQGNVNSGNVHKVLHMVRTSYRANLE